MGYGDFWARNQAEFIINLVWMMFGVSFYSFLVGSVTSILAAEANDTDSLAAKLRHLEDYTDREQMNEELY